MGHNQSVRLPGIRVVRTISALALILLLAACSGGSDNKQINTNRALSLTGSVGDGPIVDASIQVEDGTGQVILSGTSDSSANYALEVPRGTRLPVLLRVSGGTDLVTGRGADFELLAATFQSGPVTLNASPYTTLAVKAAQCLGALTPKTLKEAWNLIDGTLNVGWNRDIILNPMREPIGENNVSTVLLSNEALGEVVRRTSAALASSDRPLDADAVMGMLACDLTDGSLDGRGPGATAHGSITAVAAATAVRLEVIAGSLRVDGEEANARLDDALQTILPGSNQTMASTAPNPALIEQTKNGLGVLLQDAQFRDLLVFATALENATPDNARERITPMMAATNMVRLSSLPQQLAAAPTGLVTDLLAQAEPASTKTHVSFAADTTSLNTSNSARLSWASSNADFCVATGGWSGEKPLSGTFRTGEIERPTEFALTCSGHAGVVSEKVLVGRSDSSPRAPVRARADDGAARADRHSPAPAAPPAPAPAAAPAPAPAAAPAPAPAPTAPAPTPAPAPAPTAVPPPTPAPAPAPAPVAADGSSTAVADPIPAPVLRFTADRNTLDAGDSVRLRWTTTNAASCDASSGWSGQKAAAGSEVLGPIYGSTTFTLGCTGPSGSVLEMLAVTTISPVPLNWVAPRENVDGSPLNDLAGYRIYYGTERRAYSNSVEITSPNRLNHTLMLPSGDYYVAMTAIDREGNESAYSNEVLKTAP